MDVVELHSIQPAIWNVRRDYLHLFMAFMHLRLSPGGIARYSARACL